MAETSPNGGLLGRKNLCKQHISYLKLKRLGGCLKKIFPKLCGVPNHSCCVDGKTVVLSGGSICTFRWLRQLLYILFLCFLVSKD